ncbi:MAG: hypothetical protein AAF411_27885, partial [Myxococcota bacterium]
MRIAFLCGVLLGCSAVVDPDTARLGGDEPGRIDGGGIETGAVDTGSLDGGVPESGLGPEAGMDAAVEVSIDMGVDAAECVDAPPRCDDSRSVRCIDGRLVEEVCPTGCSPETGLCEVPRCPGAEPECVDGG